MKKLIYLVVLFSFSALAELPQKHFPVDDFLRPRVDFWKQIFSEVYSYEGLIHDDEDLSIVYEKFNFKGKSRRSKIRLVKRKKRKLRAQITKIIKKRMKNLTDEEEALLDKMKNPSLAELRKMPHRVRFQQGMRDRYVKGLQRSYLYLDKIKEAMKEEGLPIELSYLPHVESSFNYLAYSKVGAAGIWQFMRSTGRIYKLKLNYVVDERRDPIKATHAAAKLLRDNYRKLGTWPLALTAYNHGARSMERAIKGVGTTNMSTIIQKYKGRRFGFASRNFYPSFVAAAELAQEPDKYFPSIEKKKMAPYTEIKLDKPLTVKQIRKALGISQRTFKKFNLSIRPIAYRNDLYLPKNFKIKVPKITPLELNEYKQAIAAIKVKPLDLKSGGVHIVSRGESLYLISKIYKTSVRDLIALNRLSSPSRIRAGMRLKIPSENFKASQAKKTTMLAQVDSKKKDAARQKRLKAIEEKLMAKEDESNATSQPNEVIEKGDDEPGVWDRFMAYMKSSDKTEDDSEIDDEQLSDVKTTAFTKKELSNMNSEDIFKEYNFDIKKISAKVHQITVEPEETIGHYCDWLILRSSKIRRLNNMRRNSIRVGQKLKIPMTEDQAVQFNIKRIEYHMMIEEDFYSNFKVMELKNIAFVVETH
jgi:membrane-bound lytic murein transglycosylase D